MKRIILTIAAVASALMFAGCNNANKKAAEEPESKSLVLYYSKSGTTKQVADQIVALTGADVATFDVKDAYPEDYDATIQRCLKEREEGIVPELDSLAVDLSEYDTIYLGYPIWFGTYAPPVAALLNVADFTGKTIIPFTTFGSGGRNTSLADLKAKLPDSVVYDAFGIRQARIDKAAEEVKAFLIKNGLIEGEYVAPAEYSELQDVTEADKAIFDEATSGYSMLSATPVKVGSRTTETGTDYKFTAQSAGPDGSTSEIVIYVTKPSAEGSTAEFTEVER